MSEEDVRSGLRDAVADEPPLHFDPDELVATARSQVRRRALVAAGLATVAIAVAAVAVPAMVGRDGSGTTPVADRPASSTPSPSPSTSAVPSPRPDQWPPPGVEPVTRTVDELRQRGKEMGEHLRGSLPATLPSATDFVHGEFGGEAEGEYYPEQTSINAAISFTIDGRRYSIVVTSWLPGSTGSPAETCVANCHRLPDQAAGALYDQTEDYDQGVIETVFHFRDTGAMVSVAAYNYDMTSGAMPTYHQSLPVSLDQLVAIATDPELEL
ncbi:hypothetical protein [Actinophytocola algeriensis]|uniref:Uncharacterized protein n=1 Tax=Actinophytocola algeriensis TaxID=1768010 RepID=A0A7W7Q425_9PSEU|nr:hypothetical protein [Actinophytocola algeriensis]MBB4906517.1 hypothetical protein [Actinophytocola algeriensis]MBE1477998.1 hypothetical protein [Actinophytocola algeriensis]